VRGGMLDFIVSLLINLFSLEEERDKEDDENKHKK
jgi:hypothetical protein